MGSDVWGADLVPVGSRWGRVYGKRILILDVIAIRDDGLVRVRRPDLGSQSSNYEHWIGAHWLRTRFVRLPDPVSSSSSSASD